MLYIFKVHALHLLLFRLISDIIEQFRHSYSVKIVPWGKLVARMKLENKLLETWLINSMHVFGQKMKPTSLKSVYGYLQVYYIIILHFLKHFFLYVAISLYVCFYFSNHHPLYLALSSHVHFPSHVNVHHACAMYSIIIVTMKIVNELPSMPDLIMYSVVEYCTGFTDWSVHVHVHTRTLYVHCTCVLEVWFLTYYTSTCTCVFMCTVCVFAFYWGSILP